MEHPHDDNPLQAYFDWQVTTIMLAHDIHDPIPAGDGDAAVERRRRVEDEVRAFTLKLIPEELQRNPSLDWPPDLLRNITRATLEHAAAIAKG